MFIFKVRSPGQAPYGARSACAKRATYPDPPPRSPPFTVAQQLEVLRLGGCEHDDALDVDAVVLLAAPLSKRGVRRSGGELGERGSFLLLKTRQKAERC